MQKAYENSYVISICTIDENLPRVLTHMLEQLESCQKSLSGLVVIWLFGSFSILTFIYFMI